MRERTTAPSEWHLTPTCTDAFLAIWGAICGLAALGVGVYLAASGLVSVGAIFSTVGLILLGTDARVYYVRGVRHVYEGSARELRFVGPHRDVTVAIGQVRSLTHRFMAEMMPWHVQTDNGSFHLPMDLSGPASLLREISNRNPNAVTRRAPF